MKGTPSRKKPARTSQKVESKAGRHPKSSERRVRKNFTVDPNLFEAMQDLCHSRGKSVSDEINRFFAAYIMSSQNQVNAAQVPGFGTITLPKPQDALQAAINLALRA